MIRASVHKMSLKTFCWSLQRLPLATSCTKSVRNTNEREINIVPQNKHFSEFLVRGCLYPIIETPSARVLSRRTLRIARAHAYSAPRLRHTLEPCILERSRLLHCHAIIPTDISCDDKNPHTQKEKDKRTRTITSHTAPTCGPNDCPENVSTGIIVHFIVFGVLL